MTLEEKARQQIDATLSRCGWILQDYRDMSHIRRSGKIM
jgi:hypothetical protein